MKNIQKWMKMNENEWKWVKMSENVKMCVFSIFFKNCQKM